MGRRSQLFRRRGRGRRAESRGKPEGRGRGFSAPRSLWGTSRRAAEGAGAGSGAPPRPRRESRGGRAEAAAAGAPSSAAAGVVRGASGETGQPPGGAGEGGPELRPGEGAGARLLRSAGLRRKLGLARGAESQATLSPQMPRTLHGRCAQSLSCRLPAWCGVQGGGPAIPPNAESVRSQACTGGGGGTSSPSPSPLVSLEAAVPSTSPARACWGLQYPPSPPPPPPPRPPTPQGSSSLPALWGCLLYL